MFGPAVFMIGAYYKHLTLKCEKELKMGKRIDRLKKTGIIAAAMAELQKERVKEATTELKDLYKQRDKARKILKNVEREIEDYLMELEIDDEDTESTS